MSPIFMGSQWNAKTLGSISPFNGPTGVKLIYRMEMHVEKNRKGLEIIDPFAREYRDLTVARSDAHYKKLYDELFETIPTQARAAIAKNYHAYLDRCTKPFIELMSPVSWINPGAVLLDAVEILENSLNLYLGSARYLHDLMVSANLIEESDVPFKLGVNIASTPSEIVYETPLLRLRRYIPRGETVYRVPLFMIYSLINGYYILDLTKEVSMIHFFVERGYDVFVTDWKPVTAETNSSTMEDYVSEIIKAKQEIRRLAGQEAIGGLGYCIGGVYLDIEASIHTDYTYIVNLTTLLNSKVGEEGASLMGAFSDFSIYDIDEFIKKHGGVFPGYVLRSFFDWVKPEKAANMFMDIYFYGREYKYANDAIHFWNTHSATDVAGPAHRQLLWEVYYENSLAHGTMELFGKKIDLKRITVPFCNVAALFDHIVPFPNALSAAYLIGTPPEDQMTIKIEGGHVRGVVNPSLYPILEEFIRGYSGNKDRAIGC
jgi:polyhydroxyalkanoate synthase subunit PhaC